MSAAAATAAAAPKSVLRPPPPPPPPPPLASGTSSVAAAAAALRGKAAAPRAPAPAASSGSPTSSHAVDSRGGGRNMAPAPSSMPSVSLPAGASSGGVAFVGSKTPLRSTPTPTPMAPVGGDTPTDARGGRSYHPAAAAATGGKSAVSSTARTSQQVSAHSTPITSRTTSVPTSAVKPMTLFPNRSIQPLPTTPHPTNYSSPHTPSPSLAELSNAVAKLTSSVDSLRALTDSQQLVIQGQQSEIVSLRNELAQHKAEEVTAHNSLVTKMENVDAGLHACESSLNNLIKHFNNSNRVIEEIDRKVDASTSKLSNVDAKINSAKGLIMRTRKDVSALRERVFANDSTTNKVKDLESRFLQNSTRVGNLVNKVQALDMNLNAQASRISTISSTLFSKLDQKAEKSAVEAMEDRMAMVGQDFADIAQRERIASRASDEIHADMCRRVGLVESGLERVKERVSDMSSSSRNQAVRDSSVTEEEKSAAAAAFSSSSSSAALRRRLPPPPPPPLNRAETASSSSSSSNQAAVAVASTSSSSSSSSAAARVSPPPPPPGAERCASSGSASSASSLASASRLDTPTPLSASSSGANASVARSFSSAVSASSSFERPSLRVSASPATPLPPPASSSVRPMRPHASSSSMPSSSSSSSSFSFLERERRIIDLLDEDDDDEDQEMKSDGSSNDARGASSPTNADAVRAHPPPLSPSARLGRSRTHSLAPPAAAAAAASQAVSSSGGVVARGIEEIEQELRKIDSERSAMMYSFALKIGRLNFSNSQRAKQSSHAQQIELKYLPKYRQSAARLKCQNLKQEAYNLYHSQMKELIRKRDACARDLDDRENEYKGKLLQLRGLSSDMASVSAASSSSSASSSSHSRVPVSASSSSHSRVPVAASSASLSRAPLSASSSSHSRAPVSASSSSAPPRLSSFGAPQQPPTFVYQRRSDAPGGEAAAVGGVASRAQTPMASASSSSHLGAASSSSHSLGKRARGSSMANARAALLNKRRKPAPERRLVRKRTSSIAVRQRIGRAKYQRMFLVRQSTESARKRSYEVSGSTGMMYTVTIGQMPSCTCPDAGKGNVCKHILFVFLKVLKVSEFSEYIYQKALLTTEVDEIFAAAPPVVADAAGADSEAKEQPSSSSSSSTSSSSSSSSSSSRIKPGEVAQKPIEGDCAICFDDLLESQRATVVYCRAQCGQNLHRECFENWEQNQKRAKETVTCVYCRKVWKYDGAGAKRSSSSSAGGRAFTSGRHSRR